MHEFDAHCDRRLFLGAALAGAVAGSLGAQTGGLPHPAQTRKRDMLFHAFGRTGETVSVLGVGRSDIAQASSDELATRIIRTAIDRGVNFMDNSWDYNSGNGNGEIRMGKALRDGYRDKVFLMTKVDAARRNLLRNNSINRFSGSRPATSTS